MAPNYWWLADTHFDHRAIIKLCNRPFANENEMNEALLENINKVIRPQDVVIIAGDVTLLGPYERVHQKFLRYIPGNKIFLRGNHDHWMKEKRYIYQRNINGQFIVTCHYPMASWKYKQRGAIHLHGHSHGTMEPIYNRMDIGVDTNNYFPWDFDQIMERIQQQNCAPNTGDYHDVKEVA